MRSCPRSSCGSKSSWQKPDNSEPWYTSRVGRFPFRIRPRFGRFCPITGPFRVSEQRRGAIGRGQINQPVQSFAGEPRLSADHIVCHMLPLYKAPRDGHSVRLARRGLALEKLKNYRPSEKEPFMNDRQRDYFRAKLLAWKDEILRESRITLQTLQEENVNHPDLADRASSETDRAIELRARDRQRKLISKIDAALQRIEDNTYGYCEETGEPISLKRLEARPIATLSVEAQERHEKREKVYRDE